MIKMESINLERFIYFLSMNDLLHESNSNHELNYLLQKPNAIDKMSSQVQFLKRNKSRYIYVLS